MSIITKYVAPENMIGDFVQNFWMLENNSDENIEATVLPDGMIDLFIFKSGIQPLQVALSGLETQPSQVVLDAKTKIFAVSFKLLAVDYILHNSVSGFVNKAEKFSNKFWQFESDDINDFERFCKKVTDKIKSALPQYIDNRKKILFELIYFSNGSLTVMELSEQVYWSRRQINQYFNQQFGISLKAYCSILRFRASFDHIKKGKLFPEQSFYDQAHFIKEVKKLSGVSPKELKRNQNSRFLQFYNIAD
jgi:AraC-like DNA-binding protein